MNILEDLDREHRLLESAAGTLVTLSEEWTQKNAPETRKHMETLMTFFLDYMIYYHTKKEENLLFSALEKLKIPREKGPLYYYELEHRIHLDRTAQFAEFLKKPELDDSLRQEIMEAARGFCSEIWEHIDKEDSVFFTEIDQRIRGAHRIELEKTYEGYLKDHSFDAGLVSKVQEIISKYPPVKVIPGILRGDGCMSCRYYGQGCSGIEHEWWSEHEWEDFFERNNRD